jgi:hypothetical protein
MVAFLLLGQIPGTDWQIDFQHWLYGMVLLAVLLFLRALHRRQFGRNLLILLAIRLSVLQTELRPRV